MKKTKRIVAVLLSALMLLSAFSALAMCFAVSADGDNEATLGMKYIDYQPIPLLVIKINFDPDGDGVYCYETTDEKIQLAHKKSGSAQYGEQFCYSPDSWWAEKLFGDDHYSMKSYYQYISNGRFWWMPAEETSGTVNDGVVTVTIKQAHPNAGEWAIDQEKAGLGDGSERKTAVEAADEFVDFSKYDKNGDGQIDFTELTICYVYGGYEIAYGGSTSFMYACPTHAHVSNFIATGLKCDGVGVYATSQPYVRMGERGGANFSNYGSVAHELGHVLGAKDLYTNSSAENWVGGCGELSLMGSGSKGSAPGKGSGSAPTVLDPYYKVLYGFADEEIASSETKEYTLYSHESTKGEFNVIRINTLNPNEYLLIENRSHSSTGYDNNGYNGNMQGILIWHIDESIINSTARPNNGGEGHAAGFTVITPGNNIQDMDANSTWSSISSSNVFFASNEAKYKFPVSNATQNPGTWYTSMTAEQAAQCNIKIEFLTEPGDEMKVRISGAKDLPAEITAGVSDKTQTTMTIGANVIDYNGAAVTGCKIYLADNKNMTGATEIEATKLESGKYSASFEGLTALTEYYYKAEITTAYGVAVSEGSGYTSPVPVEDTTATITLIVNGDVVKTTTANVKIGNELVVRVPVSRKGYTFGGWYLDEACTMPYEIAPIESAEDFTIYAKWVANAPAETTTGTNATIGTTAPVQGGENAGLDPTVIVIIAVSAVVLVGGGVTAAVIGSKAAKKGKKE